jgi:hypothetical protein
MLAIGAAAELAALSMSIYSQVAPACEGRTAAEITACNDQRTNILISGIVTGLAAGGLIYGGLQVLSAGNNRIRRGKLMKLHLSFGPQQASAAIALTF